MTLKSHYRSLLISLAFVGSFVLTIARGAEFIPLEFQAQRSLAVFQMSENGEVVSAEEGLGYVHLWTADDGVININHDLQRETLSSEPLIARLSADGATGIGFMRGSEGVPFHWSFEDSTARFLTQDTGYGAVGMSDDGSVTVGTTYRARLGGIFNDAYTWNVEGGFQSLAPADEEVAFGPWLQVSGNGEVVAAVVVSGPFVSITEFHQGGPYGSRSEVLRWRDGEVAVLGEVVTGSKGGASTGEIRSISHDGSVIAGRGLLDSSVGDEEVFLWTEGGGMVGLGFEGTPHAMSSDGSVIVGGGLWNSIAPFEFAQDVSGFVWTEEGGATFYDDVTFADITAAGNVAVGRELEGRAVVWDSISGIRYLQDVLEQDEALADELEGWTLTQAMQISDDGLTLSGRGTDPFGDDLAYWLVSLDEPLVLGLPGDFDRDGVLSGSDVDLVSAAIQDGLNDATFDLNGDLAVDLRDHAYWINELAKSFIGDANLDGNVEFADFLVLAASFGNDGGWADGDFNASMTVDFADFLLLSDNFGMSAELGVSVPEPNANWPVLFFVAALISNRQDRRKSRDLPNCQTTESQRG